MLTEGEPLCHVPLRRRPERSGNLQLGARLCHTQNRMKELACVTDMKPNPETVTAMAIYSDPQQGRNAALRTRWEPARWALHTLWTAVGS